MPKYHLLPVKEIINETNDTCSIIFDIPDNLSQAFQFTQGQYLSLKKVINGEEVIRAYSLSSAPHEGVIKVSVKRLENGLFSVFATQELAVGDLLEVYPPRGNFYVPLKKENKKTYVAFAAGSGITPIVSIVKETLAVERDSKFVLFYGNKSKENTIFYNELNDLSSNFGDRFQLNYVFSQEDSGNELFNGRLSADKCALYAGQYFDVDNVDHFLLCGPQEMVEDISSYLKSEGVDSDKLLFELFYAADSYDEAKEAALMNQDFEVAQVTLLLDDEEFELEVKKGEFILTKAIEADLDVPFSCQSGVCNTCRGKVMSGSVEMKNNYALELDEVEDGFILTCQAVPTSEKVTISMDE